jgi:hypothetical protein
LPGILGEQPSGGKKIRGSVRHRRDATRIDWLMMRRLAELYIGKIHVGTIDVQRGDGAWGFGEFKPGPGFTQFAHLFGAWSLLMHEDESQRISREAAEELSAIEQILDTLPARIVWEDVHRDISVAQINIDGNLIEWRSYDGPPIVGAHDAITHPIEHSKV